MICAIYLRKSRADAEAEARGEGETLARHEKMLMELAHARGLTVTGMYRELVSGDTIADRPEMQRLLSAVERGEYDAVLCADIDRLGRGDGSDQAMILKTFKYSDTIIITPYKTYNTRMEIDEEYMEFAQFIARGELKRIKRRMWAGRVASAKEGKWQGKVPFGYRRERIENGKGWKLVPEPAEAEIVRSIFQWYGFEGLGKNTIAHRIEAMGFTTADGMPFRSWSVYSILTNPVYLGKVEWGKRRKRIVMQDGVEVITYPLASDRILADGLHEAIIAQEAWDAVQQRLSTHKETPAPSTRPFRNPLSGLLRCSICSHCMPLSPQNTGKADYVYRCRTPNCPTSGVDAEAVYAIIQQTLRSWLDVGAIPTVQTPAEANQQKLYNAACAQRDQLRKQLSRLQDLLETGVYDAVTYIDRSKVLTDRISAAEAEIARLQADLDQSNTRDLSALRPQIKHILDVWDTSSPEELNRLLKTVIRKISYSKTTRCCRNQNPADFLTLDIYPII